ncbi:hypothetical protein J6590_029840 [Homalodisca vitripennis]|nr:hypothetical protein J6590_029840 [Homalodisca vitripennis]
MNLEVPVTSQNCNITIRKRGKRHKENYKFEVIKRARVTGSAYVSHIGKQIDALTPGNDCKCRRKCYSKLPEDARKQIYDNFRSLNSKNEQDNYLQSLMAASEVKQQRRRNPNTESNKPGRQASFIYEVNTIHKSGSNLLAVGPRLSVREAFLALTSPVKIAHYSSKEYHYLNEQLNVLEMFKLFRQAHPDIDVGYKYYLKIFKEDFNLHFGRPQVDTCCTCEALDVKIKKTRGKDIPRDNKIPFGISNFMHFTHSDSKPGVVLAREYIDVIQCHTLLIRNSNRNLLLPSEKIYSKGYIPINKKKINDILKFRPYLPENEEVQSFYEAIFAWETYDGNDEQIDV